MAASQLHLPRHISQTDIANSSPPQTKIRDDADVDEWKSTTGYRDYMLFLRRLNEAVVGYTVPSEVGACSEAITSLLSLLDEVDKLIEEAPPLETPQRFGNIAFRKWGDRLISQKSEHLLQRLLGPDLRWATPYLKPYLMESFGSFLRLDYGTGHEVSFAMFLCCLTLLRFFKPTPEEERNIVFLVFVRYLKTCWHLQDVYKLEPAGSHGVWGLDDYSFLGYIFGSGQLRNQTTISVSAAVERETPSRYPGNLYFMSIDRIHKLKTGPFHEHSSQLYSIATGVPNWEKVNKGLFKMYEAEVLGKRVVVQHLPLGGLVEWRRLDN
ncbi:hypothetical protein HYDPIDRAFT_93620 [Hydnomerulius pinastri MD-312]|uniref:Serine/threonine-protein phosphatase 2A activator n=1 Tax=Hydnomerulius pinastri MD-312 TaxID=994086 RepID=A0A0C9VBD1_9AGAM|nr:hypothetical protein HYDPIDRAFT_93620 [Hydnomerulius pinastri MD-312]